MDVTVSFPRCSQHRYENTLKSCSAHYVADEPTSSAPVHWSLTARFYLPEAWATDSTRRAKVRAPTDVTLQTGARVYELPIDIFPKTLQHHGPSCRVRGV
jgi:hypothetical protein